MELNSSYNGKFPAAAAAVVGGGHLFNSHVIVENKCLTGNRSSKKDRHSKINTARGPRDRRMRLSLEVAKKFFKLQDMLGFDKASNTIQWLLINSKPAIQDLRSQRLINPSVNQSVAKKTREKARERARKRTTEKRNIKLGCNQYSRFKPSVDQEQNANRLAPWIPFGEEDQVQSTDQAEYLQKIVCDNSPMMSTDWSQSFLISYQQNLGPCHEQQFSDFQILDKPWESIGNN